MCLPENGLWSQVNFTNDYEFYVLSKQGWQFTMSKLSISGSARDQGRGDIFSRRGWFWRISISTITVMGIVVFLVACGTQDTPNNTAVTTSTIPTMTDATTPVAPTDTPAPATPAPTAAP